MNQQLLDLDFPSLFKKELFITDYQLTSYKIKLKAPWRTSASSITYRQVLLVKLIINQSYSVFGECAPMTEIGTESFSQAQQFLKNRLPLLIGKHPTFSILSEMETFPACRFALETALLSLLTAQDGNNIAQRLNPEPAQKVSVNAMLGPLNDDSITQAKQAESQGFSCLKIKVGLTNIKTEVNRLGNLLKQISPSTLIRLDANKSWSFEQTKWLLNNFETYKSQIDCIEEPLRSYNKKKYRFLQSKTNIALALDESFTLSGSLEEFPVHRLVLKPMAQGGIINSYHLAKQAQAYKINTVITSSIETAYGLWPITYLCAAINNKQFHGLATVSWLEKTLIEPPEIKHGIITL